MIAFWLLLACPAEQLGVTLPAGGVDAMSNEDLQRDVWSLSRGALVDRRVGSPGHALGLERIGARLQQMHTLPAVGETGLQPVGEGFNLCTVQKGKSQEHVLLSTTDEGIGASQSAAGVAGIVGLAKTFDGAQRPPHSVLFCIFAGDEGRHHFLENPVVPLDSIRSWIELGALGGSEDLEKVPTEKGMLFQSKLPGEEKRPGLDQDLDFRVLLEQLREIHTAVDAAMQSP
ncbi:MAG: hypothetical protein VXW32_02925 [Myxococcota bacterium]|nr:hypothetical protein [Myxococcota bacterium]